MCIYLRYPVFCQFRIQPQGLKLQGILSFKTCITYKIIVFVLYSTNQKKHLVGCFYFFPTYFERQEIKYRIVSSSRCLRLRLHTSSLYCDQYSLLFLQEETLSLSYKIQKKKAISLWMPSKLYYMYVPATMPIVYLTIY